MDQVHESPDAGLRAATLTLLPYIGVAAAVEQHRATVTPVEPQLK
jgi:hypothetical protein